MTRETIWLVVQVLLVLVLACRFYADRFKSMNAWADAVERRVPSWYTYQRWGDPITWVQHAMWTALAGLVGGGLSLLILGVFRPGFRRFALGAVVFYLVRESWGLWRDRGKWEEGRRRDSTMDVVFPALVYAATYLGDTT